jgi:hypothetical protein
MVEACPVCDTLWRLYKQATDNLQALVGKHADVRGQGDQNSVEILSHEITIGESTLGAVRRELRRHEGLRHANRQEKQNPQPEVQKPTK